MLAIPVHGKPSRMTVLDDTGLFQGFDSTFTAGRYHSLYAREASLPEVLSITAKSQDGVIMAVSHRTLPIYAVQFHPETILSLANQVGYKIILNLMKMIRTHEK